MKFIMGAIIQDYGVILLIVLAIITAIFLYKRKNKNHVQQGVSWHIIKIIENKNKIVRGEGFTNLLKQNTQQVQVMTITIASALQNFSDNFLRNLSEYRFSLLNRLDLSNNKIQSIQPLIRMKIPHLQFITLTNNCISSIRSLRRIQAQNIIWLQLNNNPLVQKLESLSEMSLPNLQYLWIQFFAIDKPCQSDMRWISKCQSQMLLKFHIRNSERIFQFPFYTSLRRKYDKLDIRLKLF